MSLSHTPLPYSSVSTLLEYIFGSAARAEVKKSNNTKPHSPAAVAVSTTNPATVEPQSYMARQLGARPHHLYFRAISKSIVLHTSAASVPPSAERTALSSEHPGHPRGSSSRTSHVSKREKKRKAKPLENPPSGVDVTSQQLSPVISRGRRGRCELLRCSTRASSPPLAFQISRGEKELHKGGINQLEP
ncbi:hypothetical protein MRX96_032691 [Rhipicephalus microplus]